MQVQAQINHAIDKCSNFAVNSRKVLPTVDHLLVGPVCISLMVTNCSVLDTGFIERFFKTQPQSTISTCLFSYGKTLWMGVGYNLDERDFLVILMVGKTMTHA